MYTEELVQLRQSLLTEAKKDMWVNTHREESAWIDGAEYVIQETMKWLKNADDYISNDEDGRAHLLKGILIDNYKKHFMKRS